MEHIGLCGSTRRLLFIDNLKAHTLDHRQIIVECAPGFRSHCYRMSGKGMIASCPVARPTTHCHSRQNQRLSTLSGTLDTFGNDYCWRWHDEFKAVLDSFATLKKQDILRAGPDINSQNT